MIINGVSIKGIYQWSSAGLQYEIDDMIVDSNNELYLVTSNFTSDNVSPAARNECTKFMDIQTASHYLKDNEMIGILNGIIGGVGVLGIINRVTISTMADLNNLITPGVYQANINVLTGINAMEYIIRVSKTLISDSPDDTMDPNNVMQSIVIQEFTGFGSVNYSNEVISFSRIYYPAEDEWYQTEFIGSSDAVNSIIESLNQKYNAYRDALGDLIAKIRIHERVGVPITDDSSFTIISTKSLNETSLVECTFISGQVAYQVIIPVRSTMNNMRAVDSSGNTRYYQVTYDSVSNIYQISFYTNNSYNVLDRTLAYVTLLDY